MPDSLFPTIQEAAEEHKPTDDAMATGFSSFDSATDGGLRGGELVVVSGRTGEGKTTWCQNITNALDSAGIPTVWFTYEMSPWYLQQKFALLRPPTGTTGTRVPRELYSANMRFLTDTITNAVALHGTRVFFIDHLHYLIPLMHHENTSLTVGHTVRTLKRLAEELSIVIVLIAHTKKVYQDEHLGLDSIRDSSLVAQEADYVFLIERVREKTEAGKKDATVAPILTNKARVMLAKNRRTGEHVTAEFFVHDGQFQPIY